MSLCNLQSLVQYFLKYIVPCTTSAEICLTKEKVFEPSKPIKWGLKYYAMVDNTSYCVRFKRHRNKVKLVLKDLCNDFVSSLDPSVANYCIFADNYFGVQCTIT